MMAALPLVMAMLQCDSAAALQAVAQAPRAQGRMERGPAAPSDKQAQLGLNVYGHRSSGSGQQQKRPRPDSHHAGTHVKRHEASSSRGSDLKRPIIVVPQGESSLVGILNAPCLLRVR